MKEDGSWMKTRRILAVLTFNKLTILILQHSYPCQLWVYELEVKSLRYPHPNPEVPSV